jgi:hypothetical protein
VCRRVCITNEGKRGGLIFPHELAQAPSCPTKLLFHCELPSLVGGATAITPSWRVMAELKRSYPQFVADCKDKNVVYRSIFPSSHDSTKGVGRSWKSFFGEESQERVRERMDKPPSSFVLPTRTAAAAVAAALLTARRASCCSNTDDHDRGADHRTVDADVAPSFASLSWLHASDMSTTAHEVSGQRPALNGECPASLPSPLSLPGRPTRGVRPRVPDVLIATLKTAPIPRTRTMESRAPPHT